MLKIGLTGGLGSGKTTVAKIFEALAVPVYYADDAAKRLMNENDVLKKLIIQNFGGDSYSDNGLNRIYLSRAVFGDPEKLALLNSLVHPVTIADASHWLMQQITPYAIKEAALMFESDAHLQLDYIIGVAAPVALRIQRVMQRDGLTEEDIKKRMNNQMDEEKKMKLCDFILLNDETELLTPQVVKLHEMLLSKAAAKKDS